MKKLSVGDMVPCYNTYTGRKVARKVLAISATGRKLTLERSDWATGQAVFFWQPAHEWYKNEYSGEVALYCRESA